jgi:predicted transcriptional regulator
MKRKGAYTRSDKIMSLIMKGYTVNEIHEKTGASYNTISKHLEYHKSLKGPALGHKNIPYYKTEEEMLEHPQYDYESLSESEKAIFHAL